MQWTGEQNECLAINKETKRRVDRNGESWFRVFIFHAFSILHRLAGSFSFAESYMFIPVSPTVGCSHVWRYYLPIALRWPSARLPHRCTRSLFVHTHTRARINTHRAAAARICFILLPSLSFLALMSHTRAQVWPTCGLHESVLRNMHTHTFVRSIVHTQTDSTWNYSLGPNVLKSGFVVTVVKSLNKVFNIHLLEI